MTIEKIAEGAYFIPSYSVTTLAGYQGGVTNQGVSVSDYLQTPGETSERPPDQENQLFDDMKPEEVWQAAYGDLLK